MHDLVVGLEQAVDHWDQLGWPRPEIILVSGSGLAVDLGDTGSRTLPLAVWLPFEARQIEGHPLESQLLMSTGGVPILYFRGRLHSYQGYSAHETVFPVRLGALLGAKTLIMTNAAGGLRATQRPGDLVLIEDQLNLMGLNPLNGDVPASWGPQFPDMVGAYDGDLRRAAQDIASKQGLPLSEGVYAGVAGPCYETPAEIRMLQTLGADLVGMSTVLEIIAARHMGLRCLGLSLVSNLGAGVGTDPMDHADVLQAGKKAAAKLQNLLTELLDRPEAS